MRDSRAALLLTVSAWLAVAAGCSSVEFVKTDPSFRPARSDRAPEVFVDRLPERPYRSVGFIEVEASGDCDPACAVERAREKGQELGCELLVDRALRPGAAAGARPVLLAHGGPDVPHTPRPKRAGGAEHAFVCGVYRGGP